MVQFYMDHFENFTRNLYHINEPNMEYICQMGRYMHSKPCLTKILHIGLNLISIYYKVLRVIQIKIEQTVAVTHLTLYSHNTVEMH